jgi:hypothetical protein
MLLCFDGIINLLYFGNTIIYYFNDYSLNQNLWVLDCEGEASTSVYFSIMLCDFYLIMPKTAEACGRGQTNACSVLRVIVALTISTDVDVKSLLQDKRDDFLLFSWHT